MFSNRFHLAIFIALKFVHIVGASPFKIEMHTLKLSVDPKAFPRIRINYLLILGWILASFVNIIVRRIDGETDSVYITVAATFALILLAFLSTIVRFCSHDLCRVFTGIVQLVTNIHKNYMPNFHPNTSKYNILVEALLVVICANYAGMIFLTILMTIYDPAEIIFLGRLIPQKYFYFPVKLTIILFHSYTTAVGLIGNCILVCGATVYGFYFTLLFSKELRVGRRDSTYLTTAELRKSNTLCLTFRSFQIVNTNAMCFMGLYLVAINASVIIAVVFLNFSLLKYWNVLHTLIKLLCLLITVTFTIFWTAILELGKLFFIKGNKVLSSWNGREWGSKRENNIMKRFRLSCKPILISYGNQFVIRKQSILVFYRAIVRGTKRALLTL